MIVMKNKIFKVLNVIAFSVSFSLVACSQNPNEQVNGSPSTSTGTNGDAEPLAVEVTITYKVLESVVNTKKVAKGSKYKNDYIYETPNHQSYVSTWKDSSGVTYDENTVINNNVELIGVVATSLQIFNTPENEYVYVNGTNHVHSDGKVVVLSEYFGKEVNIGLHAFSNNDSIKEIYLPANLHKIFSDNFVNCPQLTKIYFTGSEEAWNSIPNDSNIPDTVSLVLNTEFVAL